jgi:hypothetical protein
LGDTTNGVTISYLDHMAREEATGFSVSPLLYAVCDIICVCTEKQVARVHTGSVVARMTDA